MQADQRCSLCQPLRRVHRPLPVPLPLPGKGPQGRHGTLRQGNLAALLQGPSSDGHKCPGSPDRIKVEILGPNFTKIRLANFALHLIVEFCILTGDDGSYRPPW